MNISTKGQYGLEALLDLAIHSDGELVNIKSIAERQGISEKYLEQIFGVLKRSGILSSTRGALGGYRLVESPENITVRQILNALEGPLSPVDCVVEGKESNCQRFDFCVTRRFWGRIMEELNQVADKVTLGDLLDCYMKESPNNNLEYSI